jgi:5-methyltetrahydrofolate--homocysteine methyltransferase
LNAVYLYHNIKAGLDLAIVNAERLERYPSIPEEERRLAEDLIFWRGDDPIAAFAAHFKGRQTKVRAAAADLPLDDRLARYIVEGSRDGLIDDLNVALKDRTPLAIINGPLMAGMDEVGRLFNANELIVAEVLQSAEAMKASVRHLEPFMEKSETAAKATILLATVKGDVHDIGKNLVEIILGNNGYRIVNLGIKVAPRCSSSLSSQNRTLLVSPACSSNRHSRWSSPPRICAPPESTCRFWWAARPCRTSSPPRRSRRNIRASSCTPRTR